MLEARAAMVEIRLNDVAIDPSCRRAGALGEPEAQLKMITDTAPVFIAHCDRQGRFKFVRCYAARGMARR